MSAGCDRAILVLSAGDKDTAYYSVADVMSELCGMRSQSTDSASRSETAGLLPFQVPNADPELALGSVDASVEETCDDFLKVLLLGTAHSRSSERQPMLSGMTQQLVLSLPAGASGGLGELRVCPSDRAAGACAAASEPCWRGWSILYTHPWQKQASVFARHLSEFGGKFSFTRLSSILHYVCICERCR